MKRANVNEYGVNLNDVKEGICSCCNDETMVFKDLCEDCYMDGYIG